MCATSYQKESVEQKGDEWENVEAAAISSLSSTWPPKDKGGF